MCAMDWPSKSLQLQASEGSERKTVLSLSVLEEHTFGRHLSVSSYVLNFCVFVLALLSESAAPNGLVPRPQLEDSASH